MAPAGTLATLRHATCFSRVLLAQVSTLANVERVVRALGVADERDRRTARDVAELAQASAAWLYGAHVLSHADASVGDANVASCARALASEALGWLTSGNRALQHVARAWWQHVRTERPDAVVQMMLAAVRARLDAHENAADGVPDARELARALSVFYIAPGSRKQDVLALLVAGLRDALLTPPDSLHLLDPLYQFIGKLAQSDAGRLYAWSRWRACACAHACVVSAREVRLLAPASSERSSADAWALFDAFKAAVERVEAGERVANLVTPRSAKGAAATPRGLVPLDMSSASVTSAGSAGKRRAVARRAVGSDDDEGADSDDDADGEADDVDSAPTPPRSAARGSSARRRVFDGDADASQLSVDTPSTSGRGGRRSTGSAGAASTSAKRAIRPLQMVSDGDERASAVWQQAPRRLRAR